MRLLSAEARIPLQNMRKGTMREEDWTRLATTMGEITERRCSSTTARTCR